LRKHLRTRKLDSITQLGIDRVIDLKFGKGDQAFHILVELYASGNVILTDHEYTILSLLRSHKFDEESKIAVKQQYPFSHAAQMTVENITIDPEKIKLLIEPEEQKVEEVVEKVDDKKKKERNKTAVMTKDGKPMPPPAKKGASKEKAKAQANVKSILTKMVPYSSFPYADHVLRELDVDPNAVCTFDHIEKLIEAAVNLK
jgi:predicted ribosome quality control (RQC) complex YloA/Tae2 family protein